MGKAYDWRWRNTRKIRGMMTLGQRQGPILYGEQLLRRRDAPACSAYIQLDFPAV